MRISSPSKGVTRFITSDSNYTHLNFADEGKTSANQGNKDEDNYQFDGLLGQERPVVILHEWPQESFFGAGGFVVQLDAAKYVQTFTLTGENKN